MAKVHSIVGYRVAGLSQTTLLSAIALEARTAAVAFGRRERLTAKQPTDGGDKNFATTWLQQCDPLLQRWWQEELSEPSFAADIVLSPLMLVQTALLDIDATLTPAAIYVAALRAVAERAGVVLPPLEEPTVIVGAIARDGSLSCTPFLLRDILLAANGIQAGCLVGPFFLYDPSVTDVRAELVIRPVRTLDELLRVTLGDNPQETLRAALEWLALFDLDTQGGETKLWREAELRAAENLATAGQWLAEAERRRPQSTIITQALAAVQSLLAVQTSNNPQPAAMLTDQLVKHGYLLTATWLLVRRAFLLREQRRAEEADQCLMTARSLQQRLPFADETPILLHQLGRSYYYQARYSEALQTHWRGYLLLDGKAREGWRGADFCNSAGKCFNDLYHLVLALELFASARHAYENERQREKLAFNRGSMGEAYWRLGELTHALQSYSENLAFSQEMDEARPLGEQPNVMRAKNTLAHVLFAQGHWSDAAQLYRDTERYYRERYQQGQTRELGNLVYSLEGLARVAAAHAEWEQVRHLADQTFALVVDHLQPERDPACLPLALLAYLNAQSFCRNGDTHTTYQWLTRAERLLQFLYPPEHTMLLLEQLIVALADGSPSATPEVQRYTAQLHQAQMRLETFLALGDDPAIREVFAPFRERVASGTGDLENGQDLYTRECTRREALQNAFNHAYTHIAAGEWAAAILSLRTIQSFVVFFRDVLRQIKL